MPTTKKSKTKKSTKKKSELENEVSLMKDQDIENQIEHFEGLEENKFTEDQQEELIELPQDGSRYQSYGETPSPLHLSKLTVLPIEELTQLAIQMGVDDVTGKKQNIIYSIMQKQLQRNGIVYASGVLDKKPEGYGFLRSAHYSYLQGPDDIYVSSSQIRNFKLQIGDTIEGQVRPPNSGSNEKYYALLRIDSVNGESPEKARNRILFDNLTPIYPNEKFN